MATITFTIDDTKIQRIIDAVKGLYPVLLNEDGSPKFTDSQWAREAIRQWVVVQVARWENKVARDAIKFEIENDLIN